MDSTKLNFGGSFTRKKKSIFLLRVPLFFNEGKQTIHHIPRASEKFPLEKSQGVKEKQLQKK